MNRLKKITILALPLLFLGLIPLSLAVPPDPKPFKGTKISLFDGDQSISSSDYYYVAHGFGTWPDYLWSEMSGEERAFFMGQSIWFELKIDGALVHLRYVTLQWIKDWDYVARFWGIVFKPGDLAPGTYTFTGGWYWDYALYWTETITVTVT